MQPLGGVDLESRAVITVSKPPADMQILPCKSLACAPWRPPTSWQMRMNVPPCDWVWLSHASFSRAAPHTAPCPGFQDSHVLQASCPTLYSSLELLELRRRRPIGSHWSAHRGLPGNDFPPNPGVTCPVFLSVVFDGVLAAMAACCSAFSRAFIRPPPPQWGIGSKQQQQWLRAPRQRSSPPLSGWLKKKWPS